MRLLLVTALVAAGCMKTSEKYCGTHDDPAHCPASDAAGACDGDEDCGAMACDLGTHTCVACVTSASCSEPTKPVCTAMHACEACRAHADCPASHACLPDGSCADPTTVAYVDETGGGNDCTMAAPCDQIAKGLQTNRPILKIAGSLNENVVINRSTKLTLLADPGARISKSSGTVLQVAGTSVVTVVGLTVGGPNVSSTIGVELAPGASGSLDLQRVTIINHGIYGVRVENGALAMSRSTILSNPGGGLVVRSSALAYTIRNNFIFNNGTAGGTSASSLGGALLEADAGGKFQYNTVAYNSDSGLGGTPTRPGVHCMGTSNSVVGNLITGNSDGLIGRMDLNQTGGTCVHDTSYRLSDPAAVGFKAPTANPPDLHLTMGSPTTIRDLGGDCSAMVAADFDGETRPYAAACDLGADEYMP